MSAADPDAPGACAPLPVVRAADLPTRCRGEQWLVEPLWAAEGVGIIGGTPKSCKTWLPLELAVAVASGSDALGRFPVASPGPVLAYGAEDGPAQLRERLLAITRARTLELADLDLFLLTTPSLRLDSPLDRARLNATIERMRPRLLLLDPFVRLHRSDENSAADMAALLSELRALQRRHRLAIMVVHHLRKNAAASLGGQALRGSGDLHAWGDSNLYLRRREDHLTLSVEHRAAPTPAPFRLILAEQPTPHLDVVDDDGTAPDPRGADLLAARIHELLRRTDGALTRDAIRAALQVRNATLGHAPARLRAQQLIQRGPDGFTAPDQRSLPVPVPLTTLQAERNARAEGETAGPQTP
ncbi:MAG: AAA family ATPase [Candidatus Binatia bacterium]